MKKLNAEGFSLIEVVVASTIFLIFIGGVLTLFSRYKGQSLVSAEKRELEADKEFLGNLVREDFEQAGAGIIGYRNHTYGQEPARFEKHNEYSAATDGTITKTSNSPAQTTTTLSSQITSTTSIGGATGAVIVRLNYEGYIELSGSLSGSFSTLRLSVTGDQMTGYRLIYSANEVTADLGLHTPGTTYQISLVPDAENRKVAIILLLDDSSPATKATEIFRSGENIPEGEIFVSAAIGEMNDSMTIRVEGYPLIHKERSQLLSASMFLDITTGREVSEPVLFENDKSEITVFSGDDKTENSFISKEFLPLTDSSVAINRINAGSITPGDYCLIIDYNAGISVLVNVIEPPQENIDAVMNVGIVAAPKTAWEKYTSSVTGIGHTFPSGSKIVKLNEPVSYRLIADTNRLIRKVGTRSETAAFGIKSINYRTDIEPTGPVYVIDFIKTADGRNSDTGQFIPSVTYSYRASPRALNVANQTE